MGMITRVRGRLRSLHTLPKLDEKVRDERIAETGMFRKYSKPTWRIIRKTYAPLDKCERTFMKMKNISTLVTQMVFFMLCDRVLLCNFGGEICPVKKVTALYSLMFYNVIAYCVSYIKELIEKEDWSVTVNMTQHSNIKHLAMSATKIVLEWTKAVTFIITVTFMLLVFGLEQGLEHYHPTALYTFITWTYYMCTEKVFVDLFLPLLQMLKLKSLEALEQFYAPVYLRYYTIVLATTLSLCLLLYGQFSFALFAFYITVFLKVKDTIFNCLKTLKKELAMLGQFRQATSEEIDNCDDVCAVCLCPMERARVTPCQHMFHASCLRECLNNSNNCPICKREYVFVH
ncbi:RING finger protein 145-like isoform X2 [Euwallacea fornicatus]|uniref:RING finger protein 145-like isoform X2 n=1 Tax=Euwallacea fornicatus TaxID=995702 RepID=UPI00338FCFFB